MEGTPAAARNRPDRGSLRVSANACARLAAFIASATATWLRYGPRQSDYSPEAKPLFTMRWTCSTSDTKGPWPQVAMCQVPPVS